MKSLLTPDELIAHMKEKGIGFNIVTEDQAKDFMANSNYYMKLASYRFNYEKHLDPSTAIEKYKNLEFAYLQELSTLDMRLRYIILEMCLDLEHCLKVKLLSHIATNEKEDGYNIIREFLNENDGMNIRLLDNIKKHNKSEYCKNLIEKYHPYYPAWVFVELISFGTLTYLCEFYNTKYGYSIIDKKFLNTIRDMRNASAHSTCMINRLFDKVTNQPDIRISNYVKSIAPKIPKSTRGKNLSYRVIYDFTTLLFMYNEVITSQKMKDKRYERLKELFNVRMTRNKDYFKQNTRIIGVYNFTKKVIDNL